MTTDTRHCADCHHDKPLTEFRVSRRANGRTYYDSMCRKCHNFHVSEWRKTMRRTNPEWAEAERRRTRERREADPEKYRQYGRDHYQRRKLERLRAVYAKVRGE